MGSVLAPLIAVPRGHWCENRLGAVALLTPSQLETRFWGENYLGLV